MALVFRNQSMTIAAMKDMQKDGKLVVKHNPTSDKRFWVCGGASGPVSTKGYDKDPILSLVDIDGSECFILHNRSAAMDEAVL